MIKTILGLFFGLLIFQAAQAQKDTVVYYVNKVKGIVLNKDSADFFIVILPVDSSVTPFLYTVNEFYPNGKTKLMGKSLNQRASPDFDGPCIEFYPNGHKKSIANFQNGQLAGDFTTYFPNGKLCTIENIDTNRKIDYSTRAENLHRIECRDSTGTVLAENGNGHWIDFMDDFKGINQEGTVKDSLKNGEWHGSAYGGTYVCTYNKGVFVTGIATDNMGITRHFTIEQQVPSFKGDMGTFGDFLVKNMHYPTVDRENNVGGRVIVQFIVEKDGSVSGVKATRAPDETLAAEAVRVVKLTIWNPAYRYGMPVRSNFQVPINFEITSK